MVYQREVKPAKRSGEVRRTGDQGDRDFKSNDGYDERP